MAKIATGLVAQGVRQLIVAGGETSGAVVTALNVRSLRIGRQIDPGVPWGMSLDSSPTLYLALHAGNFGGTDFFTQAWNFLPSRPNLPRARPSAGSALPFFSPALHPAAAGTSPCGAKTGAGQAKGR